MTKTDNEELVERLRIKAQLCSEIERRMAEAKSLRQGGNTEGRTDLYMWSTPEQTVEGRAATLIEQLSNRVERLTRALWLYREFVIRNATQWQPGAGHHHPIWAMIAELVNESGGIVSGPFYEFIQPENDKTLAALTGEHDGR